MRIKLHTIAAGAINGQPGQVIEVTEAQAKDLIAGGYASVVAKPPVASVENAAAPAAPETAARSRRGARPPVVPPADQLPAR